MSMRLFIAVNFDDAFKQAILKNIDALRGNALSGNFTHKDNLHLTLAFIGEVETKRVKDIRAVMDAAECEPFSISLGDLGSFGRRDEAIYWQGVRSDPQMLQLQADLVSCLTGSGFSVDTKPFKPHITLGRRCRMRDNLDMRGFSLPCTGNTMDVSFFSLMRSERIGGRLTYTEMYRKNL